MNFFSFYSHLAALAQDGDVPKSVEDAQHRHANEPKIPSNAGGSGAQMNMRGVFLHVMADALGSVVVIISAVIMWKTEWEYKVYVDPGNFCSPLLSHPPPPTTYPLKLSKWISRVPEKFLSFQIVSPSNIDWQNPYQN